MNLEITFICYGAADAARYFKPKVLFPYHYGETDPAPLVTLLKDNYNIEVRIRRMK